MILPVRNRPKPSETVRNRPKPSEKSGFIRNYSTTIRTINSRLIEVETAENQRSVKFFARLTHDYIFERVRNSRTTHF